MISDDVWESPPVRQTLIFITESDLYFPQVVWELIALHVLDIIQHSNGIDPVPGAVKIDASPKEQAPFTCIIEFSVLSRQGWGDREDMMRDMRQLFTALEPKEYTIDTINAHGK